MPGYLVDEGGERTHAVLPLDEYEKLKKASEQLAAVRGYAMEMVSIMNQTESSETTAEDTVENSQESSQPGGQGYSWQR